MTSSPFLSPGLRPWDAFLRRFAAEGIVQRLECADGGADFQGLYGSIRGEKDGLDDGFGDGFGGHHFLAGGGGPEGGPDVGGGGAGEDVDDADAAGTEFFTQSAGKAECSVFGSIVGCGARKDAGGGNGEIVHDGAAAFHHGESGLRDQECAGEVGVEHIFPDGQRKFFYREIGMGDARVVDEDIDPAKFTAGSAEQGVDGVRFADIAGMGEYSYSFAGQFPTDCVERRLVARGEDEVCALSGKSAGDG